MLDGSKIKLVIWDLDDTFWKGTLSEGEVEPIEEHILLIKKLTDMGIVQSICSKNDQQPVLERLEKMGIRDYFVFVSINWEPKGERVKAMVSDMKLRSENVLFLDDNPTNIKEVEFYNEHIMTGMPTDIMELIQFAEEQYQKMQAEGNLDEYHKRLQSYQVLETKLKDRKKQGSNESFLMESNIKVKISEDCQMEVERIAELIQRTNQLNFTKKRISRQEVAELIKDSKVASGYISVKDKYGEYGIVGFYAKRDNYLEHFLFSCRTLGMGIEQYVYAILGFPELETVGEVAVKLQQSFLPFWINQEKELEMVGRQTFSEKNKHCKVLLKGPCDLDAIFSFLEQNDAIESEFTYVSPKTGVTIEQISHTSHIVQALTLSDEQKCRIIEELPFGDELMYSDRLFRGDYDVVCISALVDANLGVYRRKETGEEVAFVEAYYPLTEEQNWESYSNKKLYTSGCDFSRDFLKEFSEKYEFMGALSPEKVVENLNFIRQHLKEETLLIIMLGSELCYEKNQLPAYKNRHLEHKVLNEQIRKFVKESKNMACIDVNTYLKGQESFYDHLNHFVPSVYYEMSKDIVRLVNAHTGEKLGEKSKTYLLVQNVKSPLRRLKKIVVKWIKRI